MFIPLYDHNALKHLTRPYVNYALIGFTVVCFFLTGGLDLRQFERAALGLGLVPAVVNGVNELAPHLVVIPEIGTYVTYAFLHANLIHLGGNMLFLWVFGDNVEDALGHVRYLVFYIACAVAGGLAHSLSDPASTLPLVGASAAVAGVVGAYLVLHPKVQVWVLVMGRIPLRLSAGLVLGFWGIFQILNAFIAVPGETHVAWWAHIGGFAAGAALVVLMRRPGVPLLDRQIPTPPRR